MDKFVAGGRQSTGNKDSSWERFELFFFSFNPFVRGLVIALLAYIGLEFLKPEFAYENIDGLFYKRGITPQQIDLGGDGPYEEQALIEPTFFPVWGIIAVIFLFFGLFI